MDFVNDVDLETTSAGPNRSVGTQLANLIDSSITGTIDFQHVHVFARRHRLANITRIARSRRWPGFTIQALGKNSRR